MIPKNDTVICSLFVYTTIEERLKAMINTGIWLHIYASAKNWHFSFTRWKHNSIFNLNHVLCILNLLWSVPSYFPIFMKPNIYTSVYRIPTVYLLLKQIVSWNSFVRPLTCVLCYICSWLFMRTYSRSYVSILSVMSQYLEWVFIIL